MRWVKLMVYPILAASLIGNFILSNKVLARRTHIKVGEKPLTKRLFYDWLERRYGAEMTAKIVYFELITQGAAKAGVKPDPKEIDEQMQLFKDTPQYAIQFKMKPWLETDTREELEMNRSLLALATKDVKATDDEIRDFFTHNPGRWDKGEKFFMKVAISQTQAGAEKSRALMESVKDMGVIKQQITGQANIVGIDGTWNIVRPPGGKFQDAWMNQVATMRPNQVRMMPVSGQFVVVRLERIEPGRKVALDEVKDRVALAFKASRGKPPKQILRNLWDQANIQTEDPQLKQVVENIIFPERLQETAGPGAK